MKIDELLRKHKECEDALNEERDTKSAGPLSDGTLSNEAKSRGGYRRKKTKRMLDESEATDDLEDDGDEDLLLGFASVDTQITKLAKTLNCSFDEAKMIYEMTTNKGITSKTLEDTDKDKVDSATLLAAGDKTAIPPSEPIKRKRGKGRIIFNQVMGVNYVDNLGKAYLADEISDDGLAEGLKANTDAMLLAK